MSSVITGEIPESQMTKIYIKGVGYSPIVLKKHFEQYFQASDRIKIIFAVNITQPEYNVELSSFKAHNRVKNFTVEFNVRTNTNITQSEIAINGLAYTSRDAMAKPNIRATIVHNYLLTLPPQDYWQIVIEDAESPPISVYYYQICQLRAQEFKDNNSHLNIYKMLKSTHPLYVASAAPSSSSSAAVSDGLNAVADKTNDSSFQTSSGKKLSASTVSTHLRRAPDDPVTLVEAAVTKGNKLALIGSIIQGLNKDGTFNLADTQELQIDGLKLLGDGISSEDIEQFRRKILLKAESQKASADLTRFQRMDAEAMRPDITELETIRHDRMLEKYKKIKGENPRRNNPSSKILSHPK